MTDRIELRGLRVAGICGVLPEERERPQLLERLAEKIAEAVLAHDRVQEVTVAVRKLRPPVPQQLATSGVRVTRRRPGGT